MTSVSVFSKFRTLFLTILLIFFVGCGIRVSRKEIFPPQFFLDGFKISCQGFEREKWIEVDSLPEVVKSKCPKVFAIVRILNVQQKFSVQWLWLNAEGQELKKSALLTVNEEELALKVVSVQDTLELEAIKPGSLIRVLLYLNDKLVAEENFRLCEEE